MKGVNSLRNKQSYYKYDDGFMCLLSNWQLVCYLSALNVNINTAITLILMSFLKSDCRNFILSPA